MYRLHFGSVALLLVLLGRANAWDMPLNPGTCLPVVGQTTAERTTKQSATSGQASYWVAAYAGDANESCAFPFTWRAAMPQDGSTVRLWNEYGSDTIGSGGPANTTVCWIATLCCEESASVRPENFACGFSSLTTGDAHPLTAKNFEVDQIASVDIPATCVTGRRAFLRMDRQTGGECTPADDFDSTDMWIVNLRLCPAAGCE